MLRLRTAAAFAGIISLAAAATAGNVRAPHYAMSMKLIDAGKLVGEPQLELAAGEPAKIAIDDGKGSSYLINLVVDPLEDGRLQLSSQFTVASPTAGKVTASPQLVVRTGEVAAVAFGVDSEKQKPFRAEVLFVPVQD